MIPFLLLAVIALVILLIRLYIENQRLNQEIKETTLKLQTTIKDLKAAQIKLLESGKTSALASLSAGILHQLSQPITAIHGLIRFMKREMKPEDVFYKSLIVMDEQSTYIRNMLENLMEVVRHRKIQKDAVNVNSILTKAMNLLSDELRIRRIGWALNLDNRIPEVLADPLHLQQVFMNLAVNAMEALSVKATGEIRTLEITSEWDQDKNQVMIRFKDNGIGIDPKVKDRIFDPFFSTKEHGSGIGLALCHDLITEHQGKIEVNSTSSGTAFIISLPSLMKAS